MQRPALRHALAVVAVATLAATVVGCSSKKDTTTTVTSGSALTSEGGGPSTPASSAPDSGDGPSTTAATSAPSPLWQPPAGEKAAADAQDAAVTFAREYLGLHDPKVAGSGVASGSVGPPLSTVPGATVVRVQAAGSGPATSISVVKQSDGWQVVRADAASIRLESISTAPGAGGATTVTLAGTSQTFEGTVAVQARPVLWVPGTTQPVAQTSEIGGASDGPGRFSATLTVPAGTASPVVVVLGEPDASGRGQLTQATAVAVALPS